MDRVTPENAQRVQAQLELLERVRAVHPVATPYAGHMRLDTGVRELDVLLGSAVVTGEGWTLIDWHSAPLAEAFFGFEEGDEYEVEVGGRVVSGRVLQKNLVSFTGGELTRLEHGSVILVRGADGSWSTEPRAARATLPPRPPAARRPFRSPLEVQLDPAQQRVVDLPPDRSVLLLGEAGFGKTTVALHRLVELQAKGHRAFRGAVIVPTEGLKRLTELMLARRGVTKIEVFTYDKFAAATARRVVRELPKRQSSNTPSSVITLKRHPALRSMLDEFVRAKPEPVRDPENPRRSPMRASRLDLEHLFGDRDLTRRMVERAEGALMPSVIAAAAEHTKIQFSNPSEHEYAHVDSGALATVDGQRIDQGTPMEDANSVDVEDYAVLFELERMRAQRARQAPVDLGRYDCVLIDEAQEFAPLELALIGRCVRRRGTVIVAGDAAQKVDPTSFFGGWSSVMEELGAPRADRATLEVNYRCPPEVTALARNILAGGAPPSEEEPSITRVRHENAFHLAAWLTEQLRDLGAQDPSASIAVIARSAEAARSLERVLRHGTTPRLALGGEFEFRPGLTVTCVQEVKGLEFDHVIIPDASASTYPDTPESRRALYVAVTRATHRLGLVSAGPPSALTGER